MSHYCTVSITIFFIMLTMFQAYGVFFFLILKKIIVFPVPLYFIVLPDSYPSPQPPTLSYSNILATCHGRPAAPSKSFYLLYPSLSLTPLVYSGLKNSWVPVCRRWEKCREGHTTAICPHSHERQSLANFMSSTDTATWHSVTWESHDNLMTSSCHSLTWHSHSLYGHVSPTEGQRQSVHTFEWAAPLIDSSFIRTWLCCVYFLSPRLVPIAFVSF